MADSEYSHHEPPSSQYHLEYLDEFLRLRCAPDLISMGLFPNAKEITETFAVWAAIRRHILPRLSPPTTTTANDRNVIVVVGDGMTPRTAGLCAYLTKGAWQCYSIDPMLQYDTYTDMTFIQRQSWTTVEHCNEWKSTAGLRMARARIQTVSVQCRRAIVVLMHAHVTLEDAIAAVDASEGIVGIVTCPCCKWASSQEEWLEHAPDQQYTDVNLLSSKNQMNVWCFPKGCPTKSSASAEKPLLAERSAWGLNAKTMEHVLATRDGVKQRAIDLWPQIFSNGIKAFNPSSDDSHTWPWSSTTWSPRDVCSLMKSCTPTTLSSWSRKPVLLVGTVAAVRRCKHTIFYELKTCVLPPTLQASSEAKGAEATPDTFPMILQSADRMWTCVEYQRHLQAVLAYDPLAERKSKKKNPSTATGDESSDTDRVNVLLSLLPFQQQPDTSKMPSVHQNPQSRPSMFPWAIHLRAGDILVAYCELGQSASQEPQLCLVDGILLYDSILDMSGADRRVLP